MSTESEEDRLRDGAGEVARSHVRHDRLVMLGSFSKEMRSH